jgi:CrcB protein
VTWLAVLVGGFLGAVGRQEVFGAVQRRARLAFPVGILLVNLSGAFLLGFLTGATAALGWPHWLMVGVQAGLLGAYTTYSTWAVDSWALLVARRPRAVLLNLGGSLVLGVLLAWLGAVLGGALPG